MEAASDQPGVGDGGIGEADGVPGVVVDPEVGALDVGAGDDVGLFVVGAGVDGGGVVWTVRDSVGDGRAEVVVGDSRMCTVWAGGAGCGRTSR